MKKTILIAILTIFILSVTANADMFPYNLFSGTITINGSSVPVDAVLSATIGGVDAGTYTLTSAGWYAMAITKPTDATTNTIVFTLSSVSGYNDNIIGTISSNSYSTDFETGKPKWVNLAFWGAGGSAVTPVGDGAGSGGGEGGGAAGGESGTTPQKVTDPTELSEVLSLISPADLGLTSLSASDVTVTVTKTSTETSEYKASDVEFLLTLVSSDDAKLALNELKSVLSGSDGNSLLITKKLTAYKVQSTVNNQEVYISKIALTITANNDLNGIRIVEIIPKSVAENVKDVIFQGEQPKVLQADPVVEWDIPFMSKGLSKVLNYVVKKKLIAVESKTLSAGTIATPSEGEIPPVVPLVSEPRGWIIAIVIIVAGLWQYFRRKR